jgi:IS5 family transposase
MDKEVEVFGGADRRRTIWLFREKLTKTGAIGPLFARFDPMLRAVGFIAMPGQIVDITLVQAPRQRNTQAEKQDIKARRVPEDWAKKPAKLRHKDRDARWTVKFTKAVPREDGTIPGFRRRAPLSLNDLFVMKAGLVAGVARVDY